MALFTRRLKDPVCGMVVEPDAAADQLEYGGKLYYFCSADCAAKFRRDPSRFV